MAVQWKLREWANLDDTTACDVAGTGCALKSLSIYTRLAMECKDEPEDLQTIVDEALEPMTRVFVW